MGQPLDIEGMGAQGTRIRADFAEGDRLAHETRLEVAGYIGDSPDPEAILRALRRLWHTEIMLMRAVAQPLPAQAVAILGPSIEALRAAIDDVAKHLCDADERPTRRPTSRRSKARSPPSSTRWRRCAPAARRAIFPWTTSSG